MPGDLKDPEQGNPWYYDPRYEEPRNPFEPGAPDVNGYLQSISIDTIGVRLSPEKMDDLKRNLEDKGYFHRNMGDESFRKEVVRQLKTIKMARRMVQKCQI